MAEFVDYKKNPGYWFMIQLSIAEEVCKNPRHAARNAGFELNEIDILEAFEYGLEVYSKYNRPVRMRY